MSEKLLADARPAKSFFIRMLTRDLDVEDCIFDLLDNCLDGARRTRANDTYEGFHADVTLNGEEFLIADNCGGIPLEAAEHYAFHFGRHSDEDRPAEASIGLYGIGMKRAIFKIGRQIHIQSSTEDASFTLVLDVLAWEQEPLWKFPLEVNGPLDEVGTTVRITELNPRVADEFGNTSFENELAQNLARDYAVFLEKGFSIHLNGESIDPFRFGLRFSDAFQPARTTYSEDGVDVTLVAGLAAPIAEDSEEKAADDIEHFGWYITCNDRVVLAGDKTERTVWGHNRFSRWHGQYNGFLGLAQFHSDEPQKLPWTTTKRGLDVSDPIYRRAVERMKELTTPFIQYTRRRKKALERARELEAETKSIPVERISEDQEMILPPIEPDVEVVNIQYQKEKSDVRKAAEALFDNPEESASQVGSATFDFFLEYGVED